jgi:hypothetical protein
MKNSLLMSSRVIIRLLLDIIFAKLLLEYIGLAGVGINSIVQSSIMFIAILNSPIADTCQRNLNIAFAPNSDVSLEKFFSNLLFLSIAASVLTLVGGMLFAFVGIEHFVRIPKEHYYTFVLLFLSSLLSILFKSLSIPFHASILAQGLFTNYAFINILEGSVRVILLVCVLPYRKNLPNFNPELIVALSIIISSSIGFALTLHFSRNILRCVKMLNISMSSLSELFSFSLFSLIASGASLLKDFVSILIINNKFGVHGNSLYAVPIQVLGGISMVAVAISYPFTNKVYQVLSSECLHIATNSILTLCKSSFSLFCVVSCFSLCVKQTLLYWLTGLQSLEMSFIFDMFVLSVAIDCCGFLLQDVTKCKGNFRSLFLIDSLFSFLMILFISFGTFVIENIFALASSAIFLSILKLSARLALVSSIGLNAKHIFHQFLIPGFISIIIIFVSPYAFASLCKPSPFSTDLLVFCFRLILLFSALIFFFCRHSQRHCKISS